MVTVRLEGGFQHAAALLARLRAADPTELMVRAERIIVADNRKGILAGTDKDDVPLKPLQVKRKGIYKHATGPPLAPFGARSRVIANLRTGHGRDGNTWFAVGAWEDVLSTRGVPFLPYHFKGSGYLPVRNLAGVRPWGRAQWAASRRDWMQRLLKGP